MRFVPFLLAALMYVMVQSAHAEVRIDITRGVSEPLPVAVTDLLATDANSTRLGQDISALVQANLLRSGLFRMIGRDKFIQPTAELLQSPRYADWRLSGAHAVVAGTITQRPGQDVSVEFKLFDALGDQQLLGMTYQTSGANWRRIAHLISDAIYQRLTGESGYFDTRIVYVAETGPLNRRVKRLAIMDQDGANHQYLTNGSELVLTPRFSPNQQQVTYMSYAGRTPRVYLLDLPTGRQSLIGNFTGMTFAPRFSPDGKQVVMSMALNGNSEIYTMDLATRRPVRLTNHPSIDTSPSFSPDGQFITFNSDRGGSQQLYVMRADGSDVRRISFGEGRYGTPVWSPRGDLIAFTKIHQGYFHIGVMRPDGSGERLLTRSFSDEAPTWSPNGRVLIFFRESPTDRQGRGHSSRLVSIDLTGQNERVVPTPTDASDPAWSPLLN